MKNFTKILIFLIIAAAAVVAYQTMKPQISGMVIHEDNNLTTTNESGLVLGDPSLHNQGLYNYSSYTNVSNNNNNSNSANNRAAVSNPSPGSTPPTTCTPVKYYSAWTQCSSGVQSRVWSDGCGGTGTETQQCGVAVNITTLTISPSSTTIANGSQTNISIQINSSNVYAYEFVISYNSYVVECTNATEGDFLGGDGAQTFPVIKINNSAGTITFASTRFGTTSAISGNGSVMDVIFTAVSTGFSDLKINNLTVLNNTPNKIQSVAINGTVNVT